MNIETKTVRNYGTDHHYIVKPEGLVDLWERITGRKTITQADLDHLHELARYFGSGLATERLA